MKSCQGLSYVIGANVLVCSDFRFSLKGTFNSMKGIFSDMVV